jgi:hypothetical protein
MDDVNQYVYVIRTFFWLIVGLWIFFAVVCAAIASSKNLPWGHYLTAAFLFSPAPVLFIVLIMPYQPAREPERVAPNDGPKHILARISDAL